MRARKACTEAEFDAAKAALKLKSPRLKTLRQILVNGTAQADVARELGITRKTLYESVTRIWYHALAARDDTAMGSPPPRPKPRDKKSRIICAKDEFDEAITALKIESTDEIVLLRQVLLGRASQSKAASEHGMDSKALYCRAAKVWNKILKTRSYGVLIS
jgi:transposase-like protein